MHFFNSTFIGYIHLLQSKCCQEFWSSATHVGRAMLQFECVQLCCSGEVGFNSGVYTCTMLQKDPIQLQEGGCSWIMDASTPPKERNKNVNHCVYMYIFTALPQRRSTVWSEWSSNSRAVSYCMLRLLCISTGPLCCSCSIEVLCKVQSY